MFAPGVMLRGLVALPRLPATLVVQVGRAPQLWRPVLPLALPAMLVSRFWWVVRRVMAVPLALGLAAPHLPPCLMGLG